MTLMVGVTLAACGPSEDTIRELVRQELGGGSPKPAGDPPETPPQKTPVPAPTPAATRGPSEGDASSIPPEILAKVKASDAYFAKLTALMAGYAPELPKAVDNTDLLRCATQETRALDADMSKLDKSLEKEREASEQERRKVAKAFYQRVFKVNFCIDHDWKTRPGSVQKKRYGCWDTDDRQYYDIPRRDCVQSYHRWRVRSSKWVTDEGVNRYSGTATPSQPELMKRIAAAKLAAPARHYCKVATVEREMETRYGCFDDGQWRREKSRSKCEWNGYRWKRRSTQPSETVTIACQSPEDRRSPRFVINLVAPDPTGLQIGDIISVPQGTTQGHDPGLVFGRFVESDWRAPELDYWVLNVKAGGLIKEVTNADCPDAQEIAAALCRLADKKSDPKKVTSNCTLAKNAKRLKALAEKWEKDRRLKNKAAVLMPVYLALTTLDANDHDAFVRLATYQLELKQTEKARASLNAVVTGGKTVKQMLFVAELAGYAKFGDLKTAALGKACDLGETNACKMLEK